MERFWIEIKDAMGLYKAKLSNYSSFFPKNWNETKIIEEIAFAYQNRVPVPGRNLVFRALTSDGKIEIEMFLKPDNSLITAFPSVNNPFY